MFAHRLCGGLYGEALFKQRGFGRIDRVLAALQATKIFDGAWPSMPTEERYANDYMEGNRKLLRARCELRA